MTTAGIVLCGGQSRRMGQPKAWLPFGGERMLQRVVRILGEVVQPIVAVAAPGQDIPELPSQVHVVRDELEGRGPLQGLAAGLRRIEELGADAAFASSTDVPFLETEFIRTAVSLLGDAWVAVPFVQQRHHPLAAVYRTQCLPIIERLLAMDRLRPVYLFDEVPTRVIQEEEIAAADPSLRSLNNLNSPEDYQLALRKLASGSA